MSDSYNNVILTSIEQDDTDDVIETGEHVLNISVKEALRSRGAEARTIADAKQKGVDPRIPIEPIVYRKNTNYPFADVLERKIPPNGSVR